MDKIQKIAIINGPNINILGKREPNIYGIVTWEQIENKLKKMAEDIGIDLIFYQSNHEGNIVDFIQEQLDNINGVVINPAAFTKVGYSILDALTSVEIPYMEVHLSNIFARGGWHAESIFTSKAIGLICGLQEDVYSLSLLAIHNYLFKNETK